MSFFSSSSTSAPTVVPALPTHATLQQRGAMLALPSGSSALRPTRVRSVRRRRLAREGQIVSRFYNEIAGRPYPQLVGLNQTIQVQMTYEQLAFHQSSTTVPVFSSTSFALSSFDGVSEYTGLFDRYKFDQIEIWFEPVTVLVGFPALSTAIDLDDANLPSSFSQVSAKQGALVGGGTAGRYMCWKPHVAVALYSGVFTSFGNAPSTWIDCASPGVQHFGFKAATLVGPSTITYNLTVRALISFDAPGI